MEYFFVHNDICFTFIIAHQENMCMVDFLVGNIRTKSLIWVSIPTEVLKAESQDSSSLLPSVTQSYLTLWSEARKGVSFGLSIS